MMWRCLSLLLVSCCLGPGPAAAQVAWTPIYVDGSSQVDLWTQSTTGCTCAWDSSRTDCACCVKDGACACGREAPTRCAQCGLEPYCANMCNMTIDARQLRNKSGRTSGQIKSPALEGPTSCSYRLQPAAGQRVEIQLYRLVASGKHNGTSCIGGALRLGGTELCGVNERYTPPVVLFADHGDTTLLFEITERTARSQFLAYYSFTALSNSQGVGFQPRGGTRILNTECDWLYQDVGCRVRGACVAASPGYPGLYPPRARCLYRIATSSVHTRVKLNFTAVLLPRGRCATDFLALYQGSSPTDPLLAKVCEPRPTFLEFAGPNLLLEFSSGDHVPPYDYNGFMANIEFFERPATTAAPAALSLNTTHAQDSAVAHAPDSGGGRGSEGRGGEGRGSGSRCELSFSAERNGRSGSFDTRALPFHTECRITFTGRHTDVVHISLFNYKLRAPSCRSVIEVIDGEWMDRGNNALEKPLLLKLCSPASRFARDGAGRFVEPGTHVSKGRALTLLLRRPAPLHQAAQADSEYLDGAFMFHDEQVSGTLQPGGLCEAQYYGASSAPAGLLTSPAAAPLFWNVDGPLRCRHHFVPAANQSVTITINSLGRVSHDRHCVTACGDSGCQCRAALLPLEQLDHLLLLAEGGQIAACLCGNFRAEWLPVALRSWSGVQLVYSVGHYTWTAKGFTFGASYQFNDDALCGHHTVTTHSGEIYSKNLSSMGTINNFYHQHCTWILDSNVERQLTIEISTNQSRPCGAWNITVHEYSAVAEEQHHVGAVLHTFCPRDINKLLTLPWRLNTVVVRVLAMTRTAPVYQVKWRSRAAVGGPAPATTDTGAPTALPLPLHRLLLCTLTLGLLLLTHQLNPGSVTSHRLNPRSVTSRDS